MTVYKDWMDAGLERPDRDGWVRMLCPKCSHTRKHRTHKCLNANRVEGRFRCHNAGCDYTGKIDDGLDWRRSAGVKKVYATPEPVEDTEITAEMVAWAQTRGITRTTLEDAGVYWGEWIKVNEDTGEIEKRRWGFAFPFTRNGDVVMVKYRFKGKGFAVTPGAELIPWGLDDCAGADVVYVVEGEIDLLTLRQVLGTTAILSPPNGASASDDVIEQMVEVCAEAKQVILAGDNDAGGVKFQEALAQRIGFDRCWRVTWPEGCKDANDVLVQHGAGAVRECVESARPYPVQGIVSVRDLYAEIDELYENGLPRGESTGWGNVDLYYTVRSRQLTVVTGSPGSGKSVWLNALMLNLADRGWTFGVCSPEQLPLARHSAMLIQGRLGKPFGDGPTPRMTRAEMEHAREWVADRFWFAMPEENTIDAVLERAATMVRRYGIRGLVIDPWNNFDHSRPSGMTETEFTHQVLTKIRYFDMNHDLHVWLVAHPTKLRRNEKTGEFPVATPYDISGSAGFFNKADNCLSIFRNKNDDSLPVQVHVQKIRFAEDGGLGMAELYYDKVTGQYSEVRRQVPQYGRPVPVPTVPPPMPDLEAYGD